MASARLARTRQSTRPPFREPQDVRRPKADSPERRLRRTSGAALDPDLTGGYGAARNRSRTHARERPGNDLQP